MLSETVKFCNLGTPPEKGGGNGAGGPKKSVFIAIIIVLVALTSFGLGRLSKIRENKTPIIIENLSANIETGFRVAPAAETRFQETGNLVASKKGAKYHYPWCSGAQRIKETNKIWFATIEEAKTAGYTPAKNCKGLK